MKDKVNRLTIRECNVDDLARLKKLLEKDGYKVKVIGFYLTFIKEVE